jgi:hypothetical protein
MASSYRDTVDTERCYFCPARHDIEVHHIVPQRFRGSDDRENLVALCETCHKKLEQLYDAAFYDALGIDDVQGERAAHFPCLTCDDRAAVKVRSPVGTKGWFCRDCADRVLSMNHGHEVVEEVSA